MSGRSGTTANGEDDGGIKPGMFVSGTGFPSGAYVASVTSDTVFELSEATTGGAVSCC